ncbi:MAG: flagellar export protein FliJ [Candidatus Delongbacteria bacterium]|nr:flagellar export protein FliJ [Candidatus Delongbacteria bacterium]
MKQFQFRLQKVLQLRERVEKQKQQELARELQKELKLRRRLSWLSGQLERYFQKLRQLQTGTFQPAAVQGFYNHVLFLEGQRRDTVQKVRLQQQQVASKRQELVAASRERQLLESVRERRSEEHRQEVKREEAALANEMATTRFLWRQREGL